MRDIASQGPRRYAPFHYAQAEVRACRSPEQLPCRMGARSNRAFHRSKRFFQEGSDLLDTQAPIRDLRMALGNVKHGIAARTMQWIPAGACPRVL